MVKKAGKQRVKQSQNKNKINKKTTNQQLQKQRKKLKKEEKHNPDARQRLKKDPGVPDLLPAKKNLVNRLRKDRKEVFENAKKIQQQKQIQNKNSRTNDQLLAEITENANKRTRQFEETEELQVQENSSQNLKDSSKKTFFREFKKVVKAADVILEVLDARDPLGSRSPTIERQILALDPNKKIILVLNKIDLIPKENVASWLSYLRDEYPTIAFKSSTQKQNKNLGRSNASAIKMTNSENTCLGADVLLQLLKNYSRNQNIKQSISVGIIGFPNVGKSSLINSLKRTKAVMVGANPGVTRSVTEVTLDKNITLIDCPGIIFASDMSESDAALKNCINFDQIEDPVLPIQAIVNRCPREKLMQIYKISTYSNGTEFLLNVATKRGKFLQGGVLNIDATARGVLHDWNSGKIPYYTIPPESDFARNRLAASIVTEWSETFKFADIMELEKETVITALPQNDHLTNLATAVSSSPFTLHDAFVKLDVNEEDVPLEDIELKEEKEKEDTHRNSDTTRQPKRKKSTGQIAIAHIKGKKTSTEQMENDATIITPITVITETCTTTTTTTTTTSSILKESKKRKSKTSQPTQNMFKVEDSFSVDFWTSPTLPLLQNTTTTTTTNLTKKNS